MGKYSPNIVANSLISIAGANAGEAAVIFGDRRITWGELTPRVLRIASALVKLGVKRDEKVAFMFHNTPEFIEVNWGIQVAGGVPAPMNYRFIPREVEYQADHCDARVLIYDSIWAEAVEPALPKLQKIEHVIRRGDAGLAGTIAYEEFVASGEPSDPGVRTDWPDVAVMIYTGGTTGFPKGVMLTYGAHRELFSTLLAHALVRAMTMDLTPERHKLMVEALPIPGKALLGPVLRTKFVKGLIARPGTNKLLREKFFQVFSDPDRARKRDGDRKKYMWPSMPFFHDAAYANLVLGSLAGTIVYVIPDSTRLEPELVFQLLEREKVDNMYNVPTGWRKLVAFPDAEKYDRSSLRMAFTGGGSCPAALKKKILALFPNAMVLDAFGQTEMTPVTAFRIDADAEAIADRSVGRSIVEARVVDEQGNELPLGGVGEILYRSDTVMKGYYKDEDKTAEVMADGWFKSGDLGYIDESGEIRTVDRKKECINTGGEKVFPLEVEEVLREHGKIEDVAVIGVADEEWGSVVRAVVVVKAGEELSEREIKEYCRGQLAGYKIPRSVVFVKELPYSPVGKVLRQQIRDLYGN